MSSSKMNGSVRTDNMVSLNTNLLKDRLNVVYNRLHSGKSTGKGLGQDGLFEYLWDLKEVALLEGKSSVELPKNWLDELEIAEQQVNARSH
ncbi:MAG TPA: hypothetical protein V6C76_10370 [Drouetiella sp.]